MEQYYLKRGCCGCLTLSTSVQLIAYVDGIMLLGSIWESIREAPLHCSSLRPASKDLAHPEEHSGTSGSTCHQAVMSIVTLFWGLLAVALMLAGVFKRRRLLILPYIITAGLGIIVAFCTSIAVVFFSLLTLKSPTAGLIATVSGVLFIGMHVYFYLHVISLYHRLRIEKEDRSIE